MNRFKMPVHSLYVVFHRHWIIKRLLRIMWDVIDCFVDIYPFASMCFCLHRCSCIPVSH